MAGPAAMVALAVGVLGGCGAEPVASGAARAEPAAVAPLEAAAVEPAPVPLETRTTSVRRGEPLDAALARLDLSGSERMLVARTLGGEIDLRRILPGESVAVARDAAGGLREVTLQRDLMESVVAAFPEGADPEATTLTRTPELGVRCLRGKLDGSLYESLLSAGADANLVMRFADLLAWQVDFLTEPRDGDGFRILVQTEHLDGQELGFGKILAAEYRGDRAFARAVRYRDVSGELDWYDDDGESVRRAFLKSPLNYRRISSGFTASRRHPILKTVRPHWGVDYAAPQGTPVSALGSGVIDFAGRKGGYGNYIEVRHSSSFTTCYGHLWKFASGIRKGTRVEQGQVIGYVGSTGLSTGPHLDFRVRKNGSYVDPLRLDAPPGRKIGEADRERFAELRDRAWRLAERVAPGEDVPLALAWERAPAGQTRAEMLALIP
jgi:murein DD-endopeptidase MepM/ murein hydrolase activator NlpD